VNTGRTRSARPRAARPGLRFALTVVKGACLVTMLALVVGGGLQTASSGDHGTASADDAYARVVERAVTDHRCSFRGLADGSHVPSALIRTTRGDVRVVSFERGWDVYNGKLPGHLIAVCLDDLEPSKSHALRVDQHIKS
jgi:hypothetical protein